MLQTKVQIPHVSSSTHLVCGYLGSTGCNCACVYCQGCTDCVECPGLTVDDIIMKVYRKGIRPEPTYFVQYTAYSLDGINVCFYVDDLLTGVASGYYVGDIFIMGNACGSIPMQVGDTCTVFAPYTE